MMSKQGVPKTVCLLEQHIWGEVKKGGLVIRIAKMEAHLNIIPSKSDWNYYVYNRLSRIEEVMMTTR